MNKLFVSAGIVAIGAVSLHANEYAPDFTAMDATKPWSVSGTFRGFYDDNFTTSPNGQKQGSAGFEVSPQISILIPLQQTELGLRYTYGLYYYQQRENQGSNPIDQTHQLDLWVDHAFTQRLEGKLQDTFVSQQDPQLSSSPTALPYRAEGNNFENVGTATLHTELSMLFSADLGYQNTWWDYHQHGATVADVQPAGYAKANPSGPTYAGLLNQDDHSIWINLNYQYLPDLSFFVGYAFGLDNYSADEPIASNPRNINQIYYSNSRDQMTHSIYVGTQYAVTANLSVMAQAGFEYVDNYNLPGFDPQSADSYQPTANIAATYTYLPGDYVQLGFTESENSAAIADPNSSGSLTLYQESSVIYATLNHQITPDLVASVIGHYQHSVYVGGGADSQAQNWYTLGLNLAYTFNPWISADIGYNLYYLQSATAQSQVVQQGYSRNIGYASVTATF